jgi:predicted nucleic acid-binding protein
MHAAWDLRATLTAYDAMYVVLAQLLNATLITGDQRMSRAVVGQCAVEVA